MDFRPLAPILEAAHQCAKMPTVALDLGLPLADARTYASRQ